MSFGEMLGNVLDIVTGEARRRISRDVVALMEADMARRSGKDYTIADYGNGLVCKIAPDNAPDAVRRYKAWLDAPLPSTPPTPPTRLTVMRDEAKLKGFDTYIIPASGKPFYVSEDSARQITLCDDIAVTFKPAR